MGLIEYMWNRTPFHSGNDNNGIIITEVHYSIDTKSTPSLYVFMNTLNLHVYIPLSHVKSIYFNQ